MPSGPQTEPARHSWEQTGSLHLVQRRTVPVLQVTHGWIGSITQDGTASPSPAIAPCTTRAQGRPLRCTNGKVCLGRGTKMFIKTAPTFVPVPNYKGILVGVQFDPEARLAKLVTRDGIYNVPALTQSDALADIERLGFVRPPRNGVAQIPLTQPITPELQLQLHREITGDPSY